MELYSYAKYAQMEVKNKSNVRSAKSIDADNVQLHVNNAKDWIARTVHGFAKNAISRAVRFALNKIFAKDATNISVENAKDNAQLVHRSGALAV